MGRSSSGGSDSDDDIGSPTSFLDHKCESRTRSRRLRSSLLLKKSCSGPSVPYKAFHLQTSEICTQLCLTGEFMRSSVNHFFPAVSAIGMGPIRSSEMIAKRRQGLFPEVASVVALLNPALPQGHCHRQVPRYHMCRQAGLQHGGLPRCSRREAVEGLLPRSM